MTTLRRLYSTSTISALAIAIGIGASSAANAQADPNMARLTAAVERLEARVAALEGENKQAKLEAASARAELRAFRNKAGTAAPAVSAAAVPPGTYAMATKAPILPPAPSWSGLYAGAAFGATWMRGNTATGSSEAFTQVSVAPPPQPFTQIDTRNVTSASNLSGRDPGAIANLYLGYNFMPTSSIVLGGQVEGGVANTRTNLSGSGTTLTAGHVHVLLPNGVDSSGTSTQRFSTTASLDNRVMVSVLGRAGFLVDSTDLLYAIGGYTYGRFEAFGNGFGLNGGTIGAGWERQLAPSWTLRGEYRFTKFQSKDVIQPSVSILNTPSNSLTEVDFVTTTSRVSADLHSVSLGIAHYFEH